LHGNIRTVVPDIKEQPETADVANAGTLFGTLLPLNRLTDNDNFRLPTLTLNNYYPYGMLQAGRSKNAGGYRFGYQGQEADNKIGGLGQHLNYTFRNYDSWAIRFGAIDPLAGKYPYWSPFAFSGNRVIDAVELEGLEPLTLSGNNPLAKGDNTATTIQLNRTYEVFEQRQSLKNTQVQQHKPCFTCAYQTKQREYQKKVRDAALAADGGQGHFDPASPFRSYLGVRGTAEGYTILALPHVRMAYWAATGAGAAQDFVIEYTMAKGDFSQMDWVNIGSNLIPQNKIMGGVLAKSTIDAMFDYKGGELKDVLFGTKSLDGALLEGSLDFAVGVGLKKYDDYLVCQKLSPSEYLSKRLSMNNGLRTYATDILNNLLTEKYNKRHDDEKK
jgi:RHS repeat-associated protein